VGLDYDYERTLEENGRIVFTDIDKVKIDASPKKDEIMKTQFYKEVLAKVYYGNFYGTFETTSNESDYGTSGDIYNVSDMFHALKKYMSGSEFINTQENIEFAFTSRNEIYGVLKGDLATVVASNGLRNFYYQEWPRPDATVLGTEWNLVTKSTNQTTGYFQDSISKKAQQTGYFSGNSLQYVTAGSLVKFIAPDKKDLADPTKTYPRSFSTSRLFL
jgi:hypothetical protein